MKPTGSQTKPSGAATAAATGSDVAEKDRGPIHDPGVSGEMFRIKVSTNQQGMFDEPTLFDRETPNLANHRPDQPDLLPHSATAAGAAGVSAAGAVFGGVCAKATCRASYSCAAFALAAACLAAQRSHCRNAQLDNANADAVATKRSQKFFMMCDFRNDRRKDKRRDF